MTREELRHVKRGALLRVSSNPLFDERFKLALARAGHIVQAVSDNNAPDEIVVHVPYFGNIALRVENLELHDPPRYSGAGWSPYA